MSMRSLCMLVPLMGAATAVLGGEVDQAVERDVLRAAPEIVQAWQDMRFGMFVCWGPVSLTGREIGWSRGAPRGGEFRVREGQGPTPVDVYDDLYKKLKECIDVLVTCAGRNGNLALNTGPMPDGRIEPRQAERFRQIGSWLKQYGQSIYGTRGGPFWGLNCVSTRKGNTIYVHILKWYEERLVLPAIPRKIVSHTLLTGGTATLRQSGQGIEIDVPAEQRRDLDTIVVLNLDGPAGGLEPLRVAWGPL